MPGVFAIRPLRCQAFSRQVPGVLPPGCQAFSRQVARRFPARCQAFSRQVPGVLPPRCQAFSRRGARRSPAEVPGVLPPRCLPPRCQAFSRRGARRFPARCQAFSRQVPGVFPLGARRFPARCQAFSRQVARRSLARLPGVLSPGRRPASRLLPIYRCRKVKTSTLFRRRTARSDSQRPAAAKAVAVSRMAMSRSRFA